MGELPSLMSDLALILVVAGMVSIIFKWLKQPVVLGYIVAGFLASSHMPYTPSVVDEGNIRLWADIGVIFLLFALGLEFSFKKIVKMGGAPIIASCSIIFCMILVGVGVGKIFEWSQMDSLFLGGMLAMSSTTIIYKAYDDLGLRQQKFAGLVLSVLILEDILAILLMVMLSTMAVSRSFEGTKMLFSILKLVGVLILWFITGIFVLPLFFKHFRNQLSNETMIIVALGLCFAMVVIASLCGFSTAFGAFMMGSILAETIEAERIEALVSPVKDLFGAIFFVSVGMMVDPLMLIQYWKPILVITLAIIVGQSVLGTSSYLLSGQSLKVSIQSGFSMAQIGEFAFIIASLGVSLGVTSRFLYPIVVAVSVITTFITPYMIKASNPAYELVSRHMPRWLVNLIESYTGGSLVINHKTNWHRLIRAVVRIMVSYFVLSVAVILLSFHVLLPFFTEVMPFVYAKWSVGVITLLCISPFLRAMIAKKNHSAEVQALWNDSRLNIAPLAMIFLVRVVITLMPVVYVIGHLFGYNLSISIGIGILILCAMYSSKKLQTRSIQLEKTFLNNLHSRERYAELKGEKKASYLTNLMNDELHLTCVSLPDYSRWEGKTLKQLELGNTYGISIASVIRGSRRINIPGAITRLYPHDKLEIIGTDEQIAKFVSVMNMAVRPPRDGDLDEREMTLVQFVVSNDSIFCGKSIKESEIKSKYHCLIVSIEIDGKLLTPNIDSMLNDGDVVWVVGERADVDHLVDLHV